MPKEGRFHKGGVSGGVRTHTRRSPLATGRRYCPLPRALCGPNVFGVAGHRSLAFREDDIMLFAASSFAREPGAGISVGKHEGYACRGKNGVTNVSTTSANAVGSEIPADQTPAYLDLKARVAASNLDPETLLATDYLNHFNEIVMLLEMVPDMPEIMDEVKMWAPKAYVDHFRDSTIADRELAMEAYEHVLPVYREPFDQTVEQLDNLIASCVARLENYIDEGADGMLREQAGVMSRMIQRLLDTASGIIHGATNTMDQSEIDTIIGR